MKKTLTAILALVLALAMCLSFAACGGGDAQQGGEPQQGETQQSGESAPAPADDTVYELTLSMHDPITTPNAVYMQEWADRINEATDGHVHITIYGGGTLSAATDVADNVKADACDIGWLYTSYYAGQFPYSDVINLPMQGFGDPVVSTHVLWGLSEQYPEVQEEWSDFKLLMLYGNPAMIFATGDTPITSVADLSGRTMRCPSGAITDVLTAWGASPTTMAPGDIYQNMEKNNINGYIFEPSGITNFSLQEVTKYYTDMPLYDGPFALVMNIDKWNSLPDEYKEIIDSLSGYDASVGAAEAFAEAVDIARNDITAAGGEFVEVSDADQAEFAAAADEYAQTWVETMSADGFDAAGYLETAKTLAAEHAN